MSKRERSPVQLGEERWSASADASSRRFYRDDDDVGINEDSDGALTSGPRSVVSPSPVHPSTSPPGSLRPVAQRHAFARQRGEDNWQRIQAAAGLGDSGMLVTDPASRGSMPRIEVLVNRELSPPFFTSQSGQKVFLSRQITVVLPVKDPKCDFVIMGQKGSDALRAHKLKRNEARSMRDALDVADSDMSKAVGSSTPRDGSGLEAEAARLRGKLQAASGVTSPAATRSQSTTTSAGAALDQQLQPTRPSMSAQGGPSHVATILETRQALQATRRGLPIAAARDDLLAAIRESDVLVVAGETGSGKTTQLVQYLYEAGYARANGMMIGCTQPRKMAAVSVAHRVSQEVGCQLGTTVGYAIRLEDCSGPQTKIRFLTDGILLRELIGDPDASKYSVVILDEAHERSVNTDVLLGVLKTVLQRRSDFKLIVTSATLDIGRFAKFFHDAPTLTVPGRTFPITYEWERSPVADYVDMAVFRAIEVHLRREPEGDILMFMTGEDDVECTCQMIRDRLVEQIGPERAATLIVLPCFSLLPSQEQLRIMAPSPPPPFRKCIVATNIAETSMTIDGIRYVIDCGYVKTKVFKPNLGINALQVVPVSQAQAKQRAGRAGRTSAGVCIRLYTEYQYLHEMLEAPVPEIQRSSVEGVVLLLKGLGVKDLAEFPFLDPPPQPSLEGALFHLWLLGAVSDVGDITPEGRTLADLPLEPPLAKVLVAAAATNADCLNACLSIAAILSVDARSVFTLPKGREEQAMASREKFFAPESDHLTLLNVYDQFTENGCNRQWCDTHHLAYTALRRAADVRAQLADHCRRLLATAASSSSKATQVDTADLVRKAFCKGYFAQAARRRTFTEFTSLITGVPCELHPSSALQCAGSVPDYVVYNDFVLTTKEYMSVATAVEPSWLVEAGRGLFTLRGGSGPADHQSMLRAEQLKAASSVMDGAPQQLARYVPRRK